MLASLISRTAALSTIFLTVKRLIALSFGTQREQLEQRMKVTWPRPFLLRPPFLLFFVYWTWNKKSSQCQRFKKPYHDWINFSTSKPSEVHPTHFDHNQSKLWPWKLLGYPQQRLTLKKVLTILNVEVGRRCVERQWVCCAVTTFPRSLGKANLHSHTV